MKYFQLEYFPIYGIHGNIHLHGCLSQVEHIFGIGEMGYDVS